MKQKIYVKMEIEKLFTEMLRVLPEEAKKSLVSLMLRTSLTMNKAEKEVMYQQDAIYDGDTLSQENYRNQVLADLKNGTHSEKVKEMVERYYLILEKAAQMEGVLSADGETVTGTILKDNVQFGIKDGKTLLESTKNRNIIDNDFEYAAGGTAKYKRTITTDAKFINDVLDVIIESVNIKENGSSHVLELYTKVDHRHKDYNNFIDNLGLIQQLHNFNTVEVRINKLRGAEIYRFTKDNLLSIRDYNGFVVISYNVYLNNKYVE